MPHAPRLGGSDRDLIEGIGTGAPHLTPLGTVIVQRIRARRRRMNTARQQFRSAITP